MKRFDVKACSVFAGLLFGASPTLGAEVVAAPAADPQPDEIVVTATKGAHAISVQQAPIAVTALDAQRIASGHVASISDLTKFVPNVYLNSGAVTPGVNNFSIRGMGVYSTIPSTTPTVGVFVDGVYVGANAGTALENTFDLEGIEVLRGPQGLLFGRNVTAGALLLRTTEPGQSLKIRAEASLESGPLYRASAVVSGPLDTAGVWAGKLGASYIDDHGYFTNLADGNKHFGKSRTKVAHGALAFRPSGQFTNVLRVETGAQDGDGPAGQNHAKFGRDTFDFELDTTGFNRVRWSNATLESRLETAFGDGQIVNIAGWRSVHSGTLTDADSSTVVNFNFGIFTKQRQFSNELRYSGTFGAVEATLGVFFYADRLLFVETRDLALGTVHRVGGGLQRSHTWAAFSNFNYSLSPTIRLNAGMRYSTERKTASVATVANRGAANPCDTTTRSCSTYAFNDTHSWNAFTPKMGIQWTPDPDTQVYGYWTKGFRSGGYNLRQTLPKSPPGPYGQEVVRTLEVGLKKDVFDGAARFNLAIFRNKFTDLQRDVAFTDPLLGVVQTTANTADVTIEGVEAEARWTVTSGLTVMGNLGYLHDRIDRLKYSLSGSGVITPDQLRLRIPFLVRWSYGGSVRYDLPASWGRISALLSYQHLDRQFSNDQNTGVLNPVDAVDFDLTSTFGDSGAKLSLYAKNLLDRATFGVDSPLPFSPGQTFAPLNKGRVLGIRLAYDY